MSSLIRACFSFVVSYGAESFKHCQKVDDLQLVHCSFTQSFVEGCREDPRLLQEQIKGFVDNVF